jgi:hypothetical protein
MMEIACKAYPPHLVANSFSRSMNQVIFNLGKKWIFSIWSRSEKRGDFQIPTSIVWYSFSFKGNLLRQNVFSNGLLAHIKGQLEQAIDRILPYAISIIIFAVTLLVLNYMRRNLRSRSQRINEKRLFR